MHNLPATIPQASTPTPHICVLCGQTLVTSTPTVQTTTGGRVHIACADRQSIAAFAQRQRQALIHALGWGLGVGAWGLGGGERPWIVVAMGTVLHLVIHRHWWHHIALRLRWGLGIRA
jgi:hypothetical protein